MVLNDLDLFWMSRIKTWDRRLVVKEFKRNFRDSCWTILWDLCWTSQDMMAWQLTISKDLDLFWNGLRPELVPNDFDLSGSTLLWPISNILRPNFELSGMSWRDLRLVLDLSNNQCYLERIPSWQVVWTLLSGLCLSVCRSVSWSSSTLTSASVSERLCTTPGCWAKPPASPTWTPPRGNYRSSTLDANLRWGRISVLNIERRLSNNCQGFSGLTQHWSVPAVGNVSRVWS